jgi:hypothetical protein
MNPVSLGLWGGYSSIGGPWVDPELMIRMQLVG